ncbi:MAG: glutamate 5-kinase [Nitrospinota bacterium]
MKNRKRLASLESVKRVVIKIGSGVLCSANNEEISSATVRRLTNDICDLDSDGRFEVIVVTSGAVMSGARHLKMKFPRLSIPLKQAAAAIGQVSLMNIYEKSFGERGKKVAQILLTHDDISNRRRYLNARNALTTLLELGIVPIINENDSAAVHEIKFGDNDTLSAMITSLVDADLLLILSDVEGLFSADPEKDPKAELIDNVEKVSEWIIDIAGTGSSTTGVGGMKAKVMAAQVAGMYGVPTWIIGGKKEGSIRDAMRLGKGGTFFYPSAAKMKQRKHWIAHLLKPRGKVKVDFGAKEALVAKGKSLLPSGIMSVSGKFESGEAVSLLDGDKKEFARGLVNYHSFELQKIKGKKTGEIEGLLGYKSFDEVIHRDDMVILGESD